MRASRLSVSLVLALLVALGAGLALAQGAPPQASPGADAPPALGTSLTYQGRLTDAAGKPVNNTCGFLFSLWDAQSNGKQIGPDQDRPAVQVTDGLFTVSLDFGSVFDGTALWLQVTVQCSGDAGPTTLPDRQPLTASPYALYSLNADKLDDQHGSFYQDASHLNAGTLNTDRYSAYADLGNEGYLGDAAGDLARNNGTVQATLNADMVDGQDGPFPHVGYYYIALGGGSVTIPIPHYAMFQINLGEAASVPDNVGWMTGVENDWWVAWDRIDGAGVVAAGTCSLWDGTTILTLNPNISLKCPGNGHNELLLTSVFEEVRVMIIW
jgi:hypothetical protein